MQGHLVQAVYSVSVKMRPAEATQKIAQSLEDDRQIGIRVLVSNSHSVHDNPSFQQKHATHLVNKNSKHNKGIKPKYSLFHSFTSIRMEPNVSKRKFSH